MIDTHIRVGRWRPTTMEQAASQATGIVRELFKRAGNSPAAVAQAVCELCVSCNWAEAARLRWSESLAAALSEAGESCEPAVSGAVPDALWASAWEVGPGPQGAYSLQLAQALAKAEATADSRVVVVAIAAGLDIFLDAWQRHRALQAALHHTEQGRTHFQRLFDMVPVSSAIVAKDRSIVDVNRAFCERYGINKEQVRGHNMSELGMGLFDEDRMRLANQLREHRSVRNMILSGRHRNGKFGQSLVNAEMVDFDGEPRVLISSMDVTDMLRAEAANTARIQAEADSQAKGLMLVRIAEEKAASDRLRMLADEARSNLQQLSELGRQVTASLDPVIIVSTLRTGLPALMPSAGLRILVLDDEARLSFIGESLPAAPPDSDADPDSAAHLQELTRCMNGPGALSLPYEAHSVVWRHAPADARSALAVPLLAQKGPLGLLLVYTREGESHSETQRAMLETLALNVASAMSNARAYAQLRLTQEQLVQREKLAALGSLVAGVAHELNTPLGNALLLTSTLNERVRELPAEDPVGDQAQAALGELRQLVTQAGPLIERSLLCAARLMSSFKQVAVDQAADRRRSFDLAQTVTELAATLHNQLQAQQHQLSVIIPGGIVIDGFPGALLQVLTNLMLNAIQHGLAGRQHGHISIVASRVRKDAVLIQLSDNGHGISDAHLKRVFEPFFTTRLAMGGTGLGLSISYNIVTAVLGGSIQVSSPPGSGAVFRMVLPLVAPGERGTPLPGSAGTAAAGPQV